MTVFLFTDIEGSTRLMEQHGPEMLAALRRHDALLEQLITRHGGRVVKNTGDGVFAAFEGGDPIGCTLEIQKQIARQAWGEIGELRLRAVLHAGQAEQRGDDYYGLEVNRTVRLLAISWGGQILLTPAVLQCCPPPEGSHLHDHGLHQLKDLSEPQQIYELKHPDLPLQDFPALRSLSGRPHNLPAQPTPFIGRAAELAEITARLDDPGCRLLTLAGPGGIGKTRLALQAAAELLETFGHGAHFVALAPLNSSEFLVPAIAEALHYSFHTREVPKTQLLNYLREKQMLLVMDNFEHILDGANLVAEMLQTAAKLKILVTSRERLNLHGETVLEINGMRYPPDPQVSDWEAFSAVRLFVQNARRANAAFSPTPEDRPHITHICRLVEGAPLGLELASAWVRVFSCQEIASQLMHSLDILSSSLRDLPERHRSMRAVCDYSWNLLTEPERQAFRRLAVFQGPFDWQAAQAVSRTTLLHFTALIDKSLIHRRASKLHEMHSLLRQYAAEKLHADLAEKNQAQTLHCSYHAEFLEAHREQIQGQEQAEAVREISEHIQDLRAAWRWAVSQAQIQAIAQSQECLYILYALRGWHEEGVLAFEAAINLLEAQPSPLPEPHQRLMGQLLARLSQFYFNLSRVDAAETAARRSLEIAQQHGETSDIIRALLQIGQIAWLHGEYAEAKKISQECLERSRQGGTLRDSAEAFGQLGVIDWAIGDYTQAAENLRQSLAIYRQIGSPAEVASCLDRLGAVIRDQGNPLEAKPYFIEAIEIYKKIGGQSHLTYALNHLGSIEVLIGDPEEARRHLEESLQIGREVGDQRIAAYTLADLGSIALEAKDYSRACELLQEAAQSFSKIGDNFGNIYASYSLGLAYRKLGNDSQANQMYRTALRLAVDTHNNRWALPILTEIARLQENDGQHMLAIEILAYVANCAGDNEQERRAVQTLLAELAPEPTAEETVAIERGKAASLHEVVALLPDLLD